jgi:hypothetical protein
VISKKHIDAFLLKLKLAILKKSTFRIIYTEKNRDYIKTRCITESSIRQLINQLTYRDYHSGPEEDYDPGRTGDIWIFGKESDNEQIYIKLKIEGKEIKCLSFHPAEEDLNFPFKKS